MPESLATRTKGRSFRLNVCDRTALAGHAQANAPMISAISTTETPFNNEAMRIRKRSDGTERKISMTMRRTESTWPPKYPPTNPMIAPTEVPIVAAIRPTSTELGTACVHCTATLCPRVVVPIQSAGESKLGASFGGYAPVRHRRIYKLPTDE